MKTKTISLYIGWPVLRRPQLAGFQAPRDSRKTNISCGAEVANKKATGKCPLSYKYKHNKIQVRNNYYSGAKNSKS